VPARKISGIGKRPTRQVIVHGTSRSAPATQAIARGVEAIDLEGFIAELTDAP
jgi:hypothetical protein